MIDFLWYLIGVGSCLAVLILAWRHYGVHRENGKPKVKVFTANKDDATYWKGKPGEAATPQIIRKVYIRDKNRCRDCGCLVIFGSADNLSEFIKIGIKTHRPGNVHHIIPKEWGGGPIYDKNGKIDWERTMDLFVLLCQKCNLKISDSVDHPWCLDFCRRWGYKIYRVKDDATFEKRRKPSHYRARSVSSSEGEQSSLFFE